MRVERVSRGRSLLRSAVALILGLTLSLFRKV